MNRKLFLDTCVWLDLVKNPNDEPILSAIEELVRSETVTLIVPDVIKDEFSRNKERVSESARQRLSQEFRKVRKVIESFADETKKEIALETIDEVNHRLPIISDKVISSINRAETLFDIAPKIDLPESLLVRAAERAIQKKAPFHRQKNSVADAVLMEIFNNEAIKNLESEFYFITHNTNDFSDLNDKRKEHPDYADYFDGVRTKYQIDIVNVLKEINPDLLESIFFEHEWSTDTRSLSEIISFIDEYENKIWYNRHCNLAYNVNKGKIKIVKKLSSHKYSSNEILEEIWNSALIVADKVEKKYPNDLGPWSDFEWGIGHTPLFSNDKKWS